ncbi:MAG: MoxR family ATPase [Candidatus Eisenbacteria bacterium]|nr:MoxR family ATPase [Candidatus Eisenbacteria bacterium]
MGVGLPSSKEFQAHVFGRENPVKVLIPGPDLVPERPFVGREDLIAQCLAAWLDVEGEGALHFRVIGPPGVGKNELIYYLARETKRPLFIMHGHEELTPEDIACTARVTEENQVEYVGSPLLAAMIQGGICFFDEIGKVPSRSLSLLASVLDDRRTLTSVLGGFSARARPEFRFCASMNDADAATYGLPGYIDERLRPAFRMDHPPVDEILAIVGNGVPSSKGVLMEAFREWATAQEKLSPREALTLMSYAARLHRCEGNGAMDRAGADRLIAAAVRTVHEGKTA